MYKVDVDNINNKLARIRRKPADIFLVAISIFMIFMAFMNDAEAHRYMALGILLLIASTKYYFINPLLGKIELLENEIVRLKAKLGLEDEQYL